MEKTVLRRVGKRSLRSVTILEVIARSTRARAPRCISYLSEIGSRSVSRYSILSFDREIRSGGADSAGSRGDTCKHRRGRGSKVEARVFSIPAYGKRFRNRAVSSSRHSPRDRQSGGGAVRVVLSRPRSDSRDDKWSDKEVRFRAAAGLAGAHVSSRGPLLPGCSFASRLPPATFRP